MSEYIYFPSSKKWCGVKGHPLISIGTCNLCESSSNSVTSNSRAITSNSQGVHDLKRRYVKKVKDSIYERFHSYGVKFDAKIEWEHLFKYEPIKLRNNVEYKKIEFEKGFIRVFKKSIVVVLRTKAEIVGLSVREAEFKSKTFVNEILDQLPKSIIVADREVVSLHNAFVNHPFAKKEVNVSINDEKRFISDNSKGYSEFEAINPKFAVSDSEAIERDIVSLVDKGLSRDFLAQSINNLIKNQEYYSENIKSHVHAIQQLGDGIERFSNIVYAQEDKRDSSKTHSKFDSFLPSCLENVGGDSTLNPQFTRSSPSTISKYDVDSHSRGWLALKLSGWL